jgi:ribose 1,5-bisphosphokinase
MGRLIYLIGASGVGKDSLLNEARKVRPDWLVAHRYITRDSGTTERCVTLSEAEFAKRQAMGMFCLHWQAHGLCYGVGTEVEDWCRRGAHVLLNGSRRALPQAWERFGATLLPVVVTASTAVLRERLEQRGRETPEQIADRLARHLEIEEELAREHPELARIDNGGTLQQSLEALAELIDSTDAGCHKSKCGKSL